MLAAIGLHDQSQLQANEVSDEWPNRLLTFEFEVEKPMRAKVVPKQGFGFSLIGA